MRKVKKGFLLNAIIVLITSFAYGQKEAPELPIDSSTKRITYSEVVLVDSLVSKQELYSRAREWFAKAYNSANNVIQMEDNVNGKIIGKALVPVKLKVLGTVYDAGSIHYTISLYLKDGRYKYEITDFYHTGNSLKNIEDYGACENMINSDYKVSGVSQKKNFNGYLFQMDNNVKDLISDLKASMTTKTINTTKDDW